jgi:hypothetical protein
MGFITNEYDYASLTFTPVLVMQLQWEVRKAIRWNDISLVLKANEIDFSEQKNTNSNLA